MSLASAQKFQRAFWPGGAHFVAYVQRFLTQTRGSKGNGRQVKSYMGQFFNFKLGCFTIMRALGGVDLHPHPELEI
jgi:hypothetical protein